MDVIGLIKAAIFGIVECLTEFLPISSTGHLIVASSLLGFHGELVPTFEIAIPTGAMFAVLWSISSGLFKPSPASARTVRIVSSSRWRWRSCRRWCSGWCSAS